MSRWPTVKARDLLAALERIGWTVIRNQGGSHRVLARPGWRNHTFSHHDSVEIGPKMLARIAKRTGLKPKDL